MLKWLVLLLDWFLTGLFILVVVTQIVYPLWMNRPLFWWFRKQTPEKQKEMVDKRIVTVRDQSELDRTIAHLEGLQEERLENLRRQQRHFDPVVPPSDRLSIPVDGARKTRKTTRP